MKPEEKEELFLRIKKGDKEARERYIKGNLRLVLSVIRRFQNSNENVDDLFQIGCIGLMKAIDNFDTTLQVKFSTYAVPMIIGEIRRYLRDNNSIRVSRSLRDIAYKAIYARENYTKKNLREPTITEIAEETGIEKELIVYAMDAIQNPVSLFEPVYTEGGDTLYVMDQISDKKNREERWIENLSLREAMQRLSERERNIIEMRFYEGEDRMEVSSGGGDFAGPGQPFGKKCSEKYEEFSPSLRFVIKTAAVKEKFTTAVNCQFMVSGQKIYTMPCAFIASTTFSKPAIFAPATKLSFMS